MMPRYSNSHACGFVSSRNYVPSLALIAKLFVVACLAGAVLAAGLLVAGHKRSLHGKTDLPAAASGLDARAREAYGLLPLSFEANRGQVNSQAKYVARGSGYSLFLTPREALFSLSAAPAPSVDENSGAKTKASPPPPATNSVLRMSLVDANDNAKISGQGELPGKSNYFIGNDERKWIKGVPSVARVKYEGIYPGIDLTYYGNQRQLEYDFIIRPGSDPKQIALSIEGAEEIKVDDAGELVLTVKDREVRQHKPFAYQEIDGVRREVASSYSLRSLSEIGFVLGDYDATKPLVIDPVLVYSTYFGGLGADTATAITVNGAGEAFITGTTASANFPGNSLAGASTSNGDAYVAKLNAAGTGIVFASYFGGDNPDLANAITLDQSGNIYVAGSTQSFNFPTAGAPYQATKKGGPQMKKSTDGGANYSAITTGLASVNINGVAVSPSDPNTAFVTAFGGEGLYTTTDGGAHWASARGNIPDTSNNAVAVDPTKPANVYAAACSPGGVYRSTDGGATWTGVAGVGACMNTIITDASGNVYAGGFDGQGVYRSTNGGSTWTNALIPGGVVIALAAAPSSPGTIYAGTGVGVYKSTDFGQTWSVTGLNSGGSFDDSLAVDPANSQIVYAGMDQHDLKVTNDGGATWSIVNNLGIAANGFPTAIMIAPTLPTSTVYVGTTTNGILQSADNGASWSPANISTDNVSMIAYAPSSVSTIYVGCLSGADAFVTKLNPTGSSLIYSTYLGGGTASDRGDKDDGANGIVVDPSGNAIVVGVADTIDFPTQNPLAAFGGQADAFVAKIDSAGSNLLFSTTLGGGAIDVCNAVALSPNGSVYIAGQTLGTFPTLNPSQAANAGVRDAFVARLNPSGNNFTLGYSTYLGGTGNDIAFGIALDASDNAYVAGQSASANFPVLNAMQSVRGSTTDAFLTKFNGSGARIYSTYLGGAGNDIARGVAVDAAGNAYVAGLTLSANFPLTNAVQSFGGGTDAFITKINPSGSAKVYSTYLGGAGTDQAIGLALDSNNAVYVTGTTSSTEIKSGAIQTVNGGSTDAFITKLASSSGPSVSDLSVTLLDDIDPIAVNTNLTYTANVTNVGEADVTAVTLTSNLPANTTFVSASAGCSGTSTVTCNLANMISGQIKSVTIVVKPTSEGLITASAGVAAAQSEANTGNNTATQDTRVTIGTTYTVNSNADTDDGACTATGTGNGCTLREAINAANVNPSKDTILFSIGSGLQTITLASSLPNLSNPVYIDATTQPGFAGQPVIEINGTSAAHCLYIPSTSSGSTVRGFVINRCGGHGVQIDGNNNTVQANYIGTNASGTGTLPVAFSSIFINGSNNQIGGTTASARNVLSGNGHQGIAMTGSGNTIQGNYIGTNAAGTGALGGGAIFIFQGASNNMIGGTIGTTSGGSCTGACNLVSGNNGSLSINTTNTAGATNNTVQGNYIGVNVTGTAAIPNNGQGVLLMGVSGNHIIGNLISGNSNTGVSLFLSDLAHPTPTANNDIRGNFIGTNSAGTAAIPNGGGGVEGHSGASGNTIGGTTVADRNLISGNNGSGVSFGNLNGAANGNFVYGNFIGTNAAGNARLPNTSDGVTLSGVSGNHIGGTQTGQGNVTSGNNGRGVTIISGSPGGGQPLVASDSNFVQGNLIGTNAVGTAVLNNSLAGISINSSNNNLIGGTVALARNVISGNGGNAAINLNNNGTGTAASNGNRIQGNFIGTDINGTVALGNVNGVALSGGSSNNQIGGDDAADGATDGVVRARNIIAGNNNDGININNSFGQSNGNIIQGNYIGVNANGTAALPNNLNGVSAIGVNATQIGGVTAGAGNVISSNNQAGINLNEGSPGSGQPNVPATNTHIEGNLIGTNAAGTAALRNLGSGVNISGTNSSNNYVGGSAAGARNLIGASGSNGVSINARADGNFVLGNWIGVNSTGATALVTTIGGTNSFGNANGVMISGSSNNQIGGVTAAERNVISGNAGPGVVMNNTNSGGIVQSSGNRVQGNYIGLNSAGTDTVIDPTGGQKFGNRNAGVSIGGAINNLIGGTATGAGNMISGSFQQGVVITNSNNVSGSGNTIQGNILGTNVAMTIPLVNGFGIFLTNGASNNTIGGDDLADGAADGIVSAGNKIFASTNDGIQLTVTNPGGVITVASGNTIQGNLIGGSTVLRNGGNGINLNGALNNIVGGTTPGAGNVISFNGNNGVVVNCSNFSGVIVCGVGNQIRQNSIFSNNNIGIRLNANGASTGNNNQASPVVSFVSTTGAATTVQGTLASVANSQFTVEFFANDSCDINAGGAGEGQSYIGSSQVTTDAAGNASFNATLNPVNIGKIITASATHTTNGTSRFSSCIIVAPTTATISGHAVDQNGAPVSGATVTLSGGQNATATTDAAGNYSFPNLPSSVSYTVTPSLAGVTFYPVSTTLANLPADRTVNFTKAIARYTITDLGALTAGPVSIGWDVNSAGQVTGWSGAVASTNFKPFFYNNGAVTNLTPLGTGTNALGIALSDSGRVVGYSELTPQGPNGSFTGTVRGFFSDNGGALKEIGTLGGLNTQAWGVNDNGAVVGQSQLANNQTRPFLWRDVNSDGLWQQSEMIDLGPVNGSTFGRGFSISNNNIVVGNSTDGATGFTLATMWRDDNANGIADAGELRVLGNLGGSNANASGVNDNGYVCGTSESSGLSSNGLPIQRAFLWHDDNGNGVSDPGEMKNLGTLGGEFSSVLRINSVNEIIGWSDAVGINTAHAIRWKNNFMLDLNAAIPQNSGWVLTESRGVSDNGKITGYGTINGVQHAYLLTPSLVSQTVTFDPIADKTYGNAPFTLSATASSNLPVTFSVVSGPATVSGNTVTITGAGSVTLRATQAGDGTYDSASADQTFTVAPALLRVIAASKTKVFGAPNPAFTVHYSGFINGDTASSLSGSLSFTTAADNSPIGSYSITPGGLAANNYTFQYLSATLTIDQASTSTSSGNYNLPVAGPVNLVAQVTGDLPSTLPVGQGTVTFVVRQGATTIGTVTSGQLSNGQASASFTIPAGGAYTIYASYGGTGNYLGSTGLASLTVGTANPVPSITGVTPDSAVKKPTEAGQFTLLIDGNGFMSTANGDPANSSVDWYDRTTGQHANLSLTSITAAQIQAVVPYTLIRDGKTVEVAVINPGPGGGASNVQPFFVTDTMATVTGSETVIPDPVTGTASTISVTPSGAVLSAEASSGGSGGTGTLSVAQYSGDPIGTNSSPNSSAFSTAEGSGYFDVYVAPGSSFTSLTLEYSNTGGTTLYWWDGTVWALVSNQSYNPVTGTITVTVTTTSSPSIAQLTGTVFGVASGPSVGSITVTPSATVALGSGPITLNAAIIDQSGTGPYTAEINWGDGQTSTLSNVTGSSVSAPHAYAAAGSYSISVKVARGSSFGTSTFSPLVVFNPAAGSMNADGWFNAPLGSYPANPAFASKIHFNSNVKYANGATIPTGTAKVNLPGKDFVAGSLSYLTISGSNLQLSGIGTINNAGSYGILLTGIDGKLDGKKMPDKIRLKIWNRANGEIIYDSQMNAADNAAPAIVPGGGNINIKN
jgi:CSLREA domain-containing protein